MIRMALELKSSGLAKVIEEDDEYKLVNVIGEFPMYVLKSDKSVGPHLEESGFWEAWVTTWLVNNLHSYKNFIDVGSNTGYYAFIASYYGKKVLAFEPNPEYADMITESSRKNGLDVSVFQAVLSNVPGTVVLSIPESLHGSASIVHNFDSTIYDGRNLVVPAMTLDDFQVTGKTLVKIDAEGAEEMIWDGGIDFLATHKPTVLLEWSPGMYNENFFDRLEAYGDVHWLNHDGGETPINREWINSRTDWEMLIIRPRS